MDELVRHCLRELSFDGDLGEWKALFFYTCDRDAKATHENWS